MSIDLSDTEEKYRDIAEPLVCALFAFLQKLAAAEKASHEKLESYNAKVAAGTLSQEEMKTALAGIFSERDERRRAIASEFCTASFLQKRMDGALHSVPKYRYAATGDAKCVVTIKKPSCAVIVAEFTEGSVLMKHRFRLEKSRGEWRLAAFSAWNPYDERWTRSGL